MANVHSSFVYISFWKSTSSTNSEAKVLTALLSHGYMGEESVQGFDFLEGRTSNNHLFVSELLRGRGVGKAWELAFHSGARFV